MSRLPFRLGTTSYILPTDLVGNALALAGRAEDMELVLFETNEASNLPDGDTIRALMDISRETGMTYSVHFPADVFLGSRDPGERRHSIQTCLRVMDACRPLRPFAYLLHFHGDRRGPVPSDDLPGWLLRTEESLQTLLEAGLPPRLLCIETLDYPFALVYSLVRKYDLSNCLDIGHILINGHSLREYLILYGSRCRVLHLHGIQNGEDHHDVSTIDPDDLLLLFSFFNDGKGVERVLTLEVFSEKDFLTSLSVLETLQKK